MPIYVYKHPKKEEYEEVLQGMSEEHTYSKDGVEWERVFLSPNASVSAAIDPFNANSFVEKTGKMKGTVGDMLDLSAELSEKRAAANGGKDPVKEQHYKNYSKERDGAEHPDKAKKKSENSRIKIDYDG